MSGHIGIGLWVFEKKCFLEKLNLGKLRVVLEKSNFRKIKVAFGEVKF